MQYALDNYIAWKEEDVASFKSILASMPSKEEYFLGELGSWTGTAVIEMGRMAQTRGAKAVIYAVDHFRGISKTETSMLARRHDVKDLLITNIKEAGFDTNPNFEIYVMEMSSDVSSTVLPPQGFDLFLIDADKTKKAMFNHLANLWHLVKPGGTIVCYTGQTPEEKEDVGFTVPAYFSDKLEIIESIVQIGNFFVVKRI